MSMGCVKIRARIEIYYVFKKIHIVLRLIRASKVNENRRRQGSRSNLGNIKDMG